MNKETVDHSTRSTDFAFGRTYPAVRGTPWKTAPGNGLRVHARLTRTTLSTNPVDGSVHILYIDSLSNARAFEKVAMLKNAPALYS